MFVNIIRLLITAAIFTWTSTTPINSQQTTWNLSQDIESGISNNPYVPDNSSSVWIFLENKTTTLLPLLANSYTNLPRFNNPCAGLPTTPSNLQCWQNQTDIHPIIGVASTDVVFSNGSSEFTIPRSTLFAHPGNKNQVIVGWESPIEGKVIMTGTVSDIDPACGDGIRWILRKGLTPSVAAKLDNINADWNRVTNGQSAPITTTNVVVSVGTAIYLVIDPIGTYNCDSTVIDLNIAKVYDPIYYLPILRS